MKMMDVLVLGRTLLSEILQWMVQHAPTPVKDVTMKVGHVNV
jgi:hypothetical protein